MYRLMALLLAIGLVAAAPAAGPAQPVDLDRAIVEVIAVNRQAGQFLRRGTAFHVGHGIFYTNAHVVKLPVPQGYTEWYLAGGTATRSLSSMLGPLAVTCVDSRWRNAGSTPSPFDVARVKVEGAEGVPVLTLGSAAPVTGRRVTIKGFAAASRAWPPILYKAQGRVGQVDMSSQIFEIEVESGFTMGGSSGSPVFFETQDVSGIVFAGAGIENRTAGSLIGGIMSQAIRSGCPAP